MLTITKISSYEERMLALNDEIAKLRTLLNEKETFIEKMAIEQRDKNTVHTIYFVSN